MTEEEIQLHRYSEHFVNWLEKNHPTVLQQLANKQLRHHKLKKYMLLFNKSNQ